MIILLLFKIFIVFYIYCTVSSLFYFWMIFKVENFRKSKFFNDRDSKVFEILKEILLKGTIIILAGCLYFLTKYIILNGLC